MVGAGSGCSAYETKPSWQTDTGCSRRTVADVSADADPNTGASVYDSVTYQGQSGWFQVGGTSLASPLIASVYALTGSTGSANYGQTPYLHTSSLHDVTSGSNGSCGSSYLCTAKVGFDGPTGLGTPNGTAAFNAGSAPAADFTIGVSPSSRTVTQPASTTYTVSIAPLNGFTGTVALTQTGVPSGASFSTTSVTTSGSSTLTIDTTSIAPGSYPFTITGTSGSTTHSVPATLVVQSAAQTGDFTISVTPSSAGIGRTSTTTYTVTVTPSGGLGPVNLTATDNAQGLTESFSPASTSTTSQLTVQASGLKAHHSYTVTITGTSGSVSHSTTLRLST